MMALRRLWHGIVKHFELEEGDPPLRAEERRCPPPVAEPVYLDEVAAQRFESRVPGTIDTADVPIMEPLHHALRRALRAEIRSVHVLMVDHDGRFSYVCAGEDFDTHFKYYAALHWAADRRGPERN